jgi:hypothetical protein
MKKIIASLIVCGFAVAMVACGGKKEEAAAAVDSVATEVEAVVDSAATIIDSAAVVIDSAAAVVK